jgi:predicted 3-demethylubiquinone-9 3-methyltransferase (glyoxalase superfamily)
MPTITPNLWFDDEALEAAEHYVSIFPRSRIVNVAHYTEAGPGEPGTVLTVDFELDGQPFTAINGGPQFTFDEAVSFVIECQDQAEVDRYWDRLIGDGGEAGPCGWCKDRFGLSWQVVPVAFIEMVNGEDRQAAERAVSVMMGMQKLDLAALKAAYDGASAPA